MKILLILTFLACALAQKDTNQWPGRNTIVHLFEWKWNDIADECERFLQHKGYGGVQVSPVTENVIVPNRPWYERYQPISYKLLSRSGNEEEFLNMTKRCNNVGVRIYVDVIFNHMTGPSANPVGTGGSTANPDNKEYPAVPYGPNDFHQSCAIHDYGNANEVRNCELVQLKDLNQGSPYVREKIINFLNKLVDLGVAGFRVDAAKHMWPADLEYIYGKIKNLNTDFGFPANSRPFIFQEVIDLGGEAISRDEYTSFGTVTEFKYGKELGNAFRGGNLLKYLESWGPQWGLISKSEDALVFIDNHDNQRGHGGAGAILTHKDAKRYKMATAFMLAHPYGITRVMSSFAFDKSEQGPPQDANENLISPGINADDTCSNGWICEHRWRQIYNMVGFKNIVNGTNIEYWWTNGYQQIAFSRGDKGLVAFTIGGSIDQKVKTNMEPGTYCDIISGNLENGACTGKNVTVGNDGFAHVLLGANEEDGVLAVHIKSKL